MTQKCVICDQRPVHEGPYCSNCSVRLIRERQKNSENGKPVKFLHYRGNLVGLVPNGNNGFSTIPVERSLAGIPKSRVINLDNYCEGYTRKIIKRFKAAIAVTCGV